MFVLAGTTVAVPPAQGDEVVLPRAIIMAPAPSDRPAMLKGIKLYPENPLRFDFMVDGGDDARTASSARLVKYFLAGITIPEKDLWVNLSPYEKDRIVPEGFGQTDMGRDLLAQDYMLKQMTASLTNPEQSTGRAFWKRVYTQAAQQYGHTQVPVNTFNKVWVVPEKATVYENAQAGTAYVVESRLKVMLEEDYLAAMKNQRQPRTCPPAGCQTTDALNVKATEGANGPRSENHLGTQILRELIIPQLTKEVNEGKDFAPLRQVYNSLILATWYKQKIKDSILSQVYADRRKTRGIDIADWKEQRESIYRQYLLSFKKGFYNYVKEEPDVRTGEMISRKYFSGGMDFAMASDPQGRTLGGLIRTLTRWNDVLAEWGEQLLSKVSIVSVTLNRASLTFASKAPLREGIAAETFLQAQSRLLRRVLLRQENEAEFKVVLEKLGIISSAAQFDPQRAEEYHQEIYRKLAAAGYTQEEVDAIRGETNAEVRWDAVVGRQNENPRGQSIPEGVANSIDALGGEIGQFGKGVKQIMAWLAVPQDRVDFFSLKDGQAHQLQAVKAGDGTDSLQMMRIRPDQFQAAVRYAGGPEGLPHGTVVRVHKHEAIPLEKGVNSLRSLERSIHERFATVRGMRIITRVNNEPPRHVNNWEHVQVLVGEGPGQEVRGTIYVELTAHEIRIIDDGVGMDVQTMSGMLVPSEGGTKTPESLQGQDAIARELTRLGLIHDATPVTVARGASMAFVRRGEVIERVPVSRGIVPEALVTGELLVELGGFLEVDPARNRIIFSDGMGRAIEDLVRRLMLSEGDAVAKLRMVNAILAGLEFAAGGNDVNRHMVDDIKARLKLLLAPILNRFAAEGYVFLPYREGFAQLELAGRDKVLWLNEGLFDWQSFVSLLRMGGIMVDPEVFKLVRHVDGEKQDVMIVLMPFKPEVLAGFTRRDVRNLDFRLADRLPVINGDDYVVIPAQWQFKGSRFADLLAKSELSDEERRSFGIQAQLISTVAGQDLMTSYEMGGWKQTALVNAESLGKLPAVALSEGQIDSKAINGFLTKALPGVPAASPPGQFFRAHLPPQGAHLKYAIHGGKIIDLTDGGVIELGGPAQGLTPQAIAYLSGSHYQITFAGSDTKRVYSIKDKVAEDVFEREGWLPDLNIKVTPRRKFAYGLGGEAVYLLDLSTGKADVIPAKGNVLRIAFTEDERYMFVERGWDIGIINLKRGRNSERLLPRPNDSFYFDRLKPVIHMRAAGPNPWVSVNMWGTPAGLKGPLFNIPGAADSMLYRSSDGNFKLHNLPHAQDDSPITESEALSKILGVEPGPLLVDWLEPARSKVHWRQMRPGSVYKHPHLDVVVFNLTASRAHVRHLNTNERWEFYNGGEIIGFNAARDLLVLDGGQLYRIPQNRASGPTPDTVLAVENAPHPRFCIVARGAERYLVRDGEEIRLNVPAALNAVTFDGTYFVFSAPQGDEVVYLNPEDVTDLTHVPLASPAAGMPADAGIKYYVYADGARSEVRAIGSGERVVFKNHAGQVISGEPLMLRFLGKGWYWVKQKGDPLEEGRLYEISGHTAVEVQEDGMTFAITPDGKYLYHIRGKNGHLRIYDVQAHEHYDTAKSIGTKLADGYAAQFSRDGRFLVGNANIIAFVVDLEEKKVVLPLTFLGMETITVDPENALIYSKATTGWLGRRMANGMPVDGAVLNTLMISDRLAELKDEGLRQKINFDVNTKPGLLTHRVFAFTDGTVRDVFIDRRDPNQVLVWDVATQRSFQFDRGTEILKFYEREGEFLFLTRNGDRIDYGFFGSGGAKQLISDRQCVTMPPGTNYVPVFNSQDVAYDLYVIGERGGPRRLPVDARTYTNVLFDGTYLVFIEPASARAVYIDPAHPDHPLTPAVEVPRTARPHASDVWGGVMARREGWITQARDAYTELWETLPETLRLTQVPGFQDRLGQLYGLQEQAVRGLYQEAVKRAETEFYAAGDLPFDVFATRARALLSAWQALRGAEGGLFFMLDQLPPSSRDRFYTDFFHHAFDVLLHTDINFSDGQLNEGLVTALALGWEVRNERDLRNAGLVMRLVDAVRAMEGRPVGLETIQTMVRFLSQASASSERAAVVEGQLGRILRLTGRAREQVLRQWSDAFAENAPADIYAALSDIHAMEKLGRARDYVVFMTNAVEHMVSPGRLEDPAGTRRLWEAQGRDGRVALDQIADFNADKMVPRDRLEDNLYSIEDIVRNIPAIRERRNDRLRLFITQAVRQQREAGAYTAEVEQNSADAGAHQVVVRHYFDDARKVYVEEMTDDGEGPPMGRALALLIPKSNKVQAAQQGNMAGYFGKGKFTIYRGADAVELIMNNGQEAYVLSLEVEGDGRVFLTKVGVMDEPSRQPKGVTVRRIMQDDNVLRELEQMLSMRAWKTFAGMASTAGVTVYFENANGRKPVQVKGTAMLGETDLILRLAGSAAPVNMGKMRLWSTQDTDMPIQVVDKGGRRVDDLSHKERLLALVPQSWRTYVRDLRLVIQLPLPLIENRSAFVDEEELLPQIQQHIAAALYKALVTKRLREERFFLDPVPRDFETNLKDSYDTALDPRQTPNLRLSKSRHLFDLARDISHKAPHELKGGELEMIRRWFDGEGGRDARVAEERERAFISFITQVEVDIGDGLGPGSLLMRRIKAQSERRPEQARRLAASTGVDFTRAVNTFDPYARERSERVAQGIRSQDAVMGPVGQSALTPEEKELLRLGRDIAGMFGFTQVAVVKNAPFGGRFVLRPKPMRLLLAAELALKLHRIGSGQEGEIHEPTGTLAHELAHLFEVVADARASSLTAISTPRGSQDFTHDERFIRFNRLVAAMVLVSGDSAQTVRPPSTTSAIFPSPEGGIDFKGDKMDILNVQTGGGGASTAVDSAMLRQLENVPGFTPVITGIRPLADIKLFLGVSEVPVSPAQP